MTQTKWKARNRRNLIIEVWEQLGCESVGASELNQIREAICDAFGEVAAASPAAIARTLADDGAVLRHAEVLELDTTWRRQNHFMNLRGVDFSSLDRAELAIRNFEILRQELLRANNRAGLRQLDRFADETREEIMLEAGSLVIQPSRRLESEEIAQWLSVWRQTPELFVNWLKLRRISQEFTKRFGSESL